MNCRATVRAERIPVDANASSGAKVNAANEISLRDLARFFYFPQPAGGAMNLAAAIQEITVNWPNRPVVRLIDTNEDNALVAVSARHLVSS